MRARNQQTHVIPSACSSRVSTRARRGLGLSGSAGCEIICGFTDESAPPGLRAGGTEEADTVRALVVLVKFRDDTFLPTNQPIDWPLYADPTQLPPFASGLLDPSSDPATFRDSTLTKFFYEQSKPGPNQPGQRHLFGEVVPEVHVTAFDEDAYTRANGSGYGYIVQEALDGIFPLSPVDIRPGLYDPADYDLDGDGILDELFFILRKRNAGSIWNGCATLNVTSCNTFSISGDPGLVQYYSPSRDAYVRVEWFSTSGSWTVGLTRGQWAYRPQLYYVRVMGHEYGHHLWGGNHVGQYSGNDLPVDVNPSDRGNHYALMATNFIQHDITMESTERDDFGWVDIEDLTTSKTVVLGDLWGSAEAAKRDLGVIDGDALTLYMQNRQRVGYFNQAFETPVRDIGLLETGLLITLPRTNNDKARDVVPASGELFHPQQVGSFEGIMFGQNKVLSQLTPWTRPNSSGFFEYPAGVEPTWIGIDDIRSEGGPATFEYYEDYRVAPTVFIRNDSWMGAESNGTAFPNEVRVTEGATLTVEANTALTFDGGLVIEDGASVVFEIGSVVTLGPGAELVGEPGSQVTMNLRADVRLSAGSRVDVHALTAIGNSIKPVTFTQATPGTRWDRIILRDGPGTSHELNHIRIEGGTVGLLVRARNDDDPRQAGAYITNTQLLDNGVGLLTDNVPCAGDVCIESSSFRSSVSLDRVLVENSVTHGLYLRNTDVSLYNSTVRGNGRHGIVVTNASTTGFADNVVEGNGPSGSSYDGLRVGTNGSVDLSRQGDILGPPARNRFADNADHQVAYVDGYLLLGQDGFGGGLNTITEPGTGCRVFNGTAGTLYAENNYWGTSTAPSAAYFCGTIVDADPFLTADPTSGSGGGYRTAATPVLARGSTGPTEGSNGYTLDELGAEIEAVRSTIAADPGAPEAAGLVRYLGALHRLDEANETGHLAATGALLEGLRQGLGSGLAPDHRRTAEQALLVEVEFALAAEDYDMADMLVTVSGVHVEGEDEARTLAINAVAVDEALGRYTEALDRLGVLLAEVTDEELLEDLEFLAEQLAAKVDEASVAGAVASRGGGDAASKTAGVSQGSVAVPLPTAYALQAAYPNPTSRGATVPFDLPEAAEVRIVVYDLLGREVAVLTEGLHEAGRHQASFEASRLSAGVYVIRAEVVPAAGAVRAFTQKLTLVR